MRGPGQSTAIDIASLSQYEDPYPEYARLRKLGPLHPGPESGSWVAISHPLVQEILTDRRRYSAQLEQAKPSVWEIEGARHGKLRAQTLADFLPARVRQLEGWMAELAETMIQDLDGPEFEFVGQLAEPFTTRVIARLLGIDSVHDGLLQLWASPLCDQRTRESEKLNAPVGAALRASLQRRIIELSMCAPDSLLSRLVKKPATGDQLELSDASAILASLVYAATHTTRHAMAQTVHLLAQRPHLWANLRKGNLSQRKVIAETLRFDPPAYSARRRVVSRTIVAGKTMAQGDHIFLMLGAANRDPQQFPNPDRFDVERCQRGNLAFGRGRHHCVGEALTRYQMNAMLAALIRRFVSLDLGDGSTRIRSMRVRGFKALQVVGVIEQDSRRSIAVDQRGPSTSRPVQQPR